MHSNTRRHSGASPLLSTFIPKSCIYSDFDDTVVSRLITYQKRYKQNTGRQKNVLLVLDDLAYSKALKSPVLKRLFLNGRHSNICVILTLQYSLQLSIELRNNIDIAFCGRDSIRASQKRLHEYYFGAFESMPQFTKVLSAVTEKYGFLVAKNNDSSCSNALTDQIFWSRADLSKLPARWRMGKASVWQLDRQYFDAAKMQRIENEEDNADDIQVQSASAAAAVGMQQQQKDTVQMVDKHGASSSI